MHRLLLTAALLACTAVQAQPLTCDREALRDGLKALDKLADAQERMRGAALILGGGCTGFSNLQRKDLEGMFKAPPEELREYAVDVFLTPADTEKSAFCPGKRFALRYAPAPKRAAHFDACKLGKRKLFSRAAWTAALAPEPAYVLDEALRKAKVPAPMAAVYARHFSGPGLYDALMRDPAKRDPFEPEVKGATCNHKGLDEGLEMNANNPIYPDAGMRYAVSMLVEECAGALPREWRQAFAFMLELENLDYVRTALWAGLFPEPNLPLARRLCPSRAFPKPDMTAAERKATYLGCGFDKQGALTLEEWTEAEAPEAGAAVYEFLLLQKLPKEKARRIAVLLSGVGARKAFEAQQARDALP